MAAAVTPKREPDLEIIDVDEAADFDDMGPFIPTPQKKRRTSLPQPTTSSAVSTPSGSKARRPPASKSNPSPRAARQPQLNRPRVQPERGIATPTASPDETAVRRRVAEVAQASSTRPRRSVGAELAASPAEEKVRPEEMVLEKSLVLEVKKVKETAERNIGGGADSSDDEKDAIILVGGTRSLWGGQKEEEEDPFKHDLALEGSTSTSSHHIRNDPAPRQTASASPRLHPPSPPSPAPLYQAPPEQHLSPPASSLSPRSRISESVASSVHLLVLPTPSPPPPSTTISTFLSSLPLPLFRLESTFDTLGCTSHVDLLALSNDSIVGRGARKALLDTVARDVEGGVSKWERMVLEEGLRAFRAQGEDEGEE